LKGAVELRNEEDEKNVFKNIIFKFIIKLRPKAYLESA
jgi:hypothetical protein